MKVLGLIPARYGSQRCPRKNVADLGGQPLITWSIKAAQQALVCDVIAVSTDDPEAASVAAANGCMVIQRPPELCQPETPMLPVLKHALQFFDADVIILLQPTSPFRSAEDVIEAMAMFTSRNADSVLSVVKAPEHLTFEVGHAGRLRECRSIVIENGALYLISVAHLNAGGDWYDGMAYLYQMPKERSLDIDTIADLEAARALVK